MRKSDGDILTIFISIFLLLLLWSCESETKKSERLAKQYCAACHMFPEPSLLNKGEWRNVLPEMKFRMGLDVSGLFRIPRQDLETVAQLLPGPMITEQDWQLIERYYLSNSPDSLYKRADTVLQKLVQFDPEKIPVSFPGGPFVTCLGYDSLEKNFLVGDINSKLYRLSPEFIVEDSFQFPAPVSSVSFFSQYSLIATTIGMINPNDQRNGQVFVINENEDQFLKILDSLRRPVHTLVTDLNLDGESELIISEFGNFVGALSVFEKTGNGYRTHTLMASPGCRKVEIHDVNGDKLPDILTLFTQGDEQLVLFLNKGDFLFDRKIIMRFPPVYGSSYFESVDMDDDGDLDIVYSNGDNADFSMTLKPYHGVRIFTNDGKNNFSETWFYQMDGASQVTANDFDKDGDYDLAAISYFPDYQREPSKAFIYFENTGSEFIPYVTQLSIGNRWLLMNVGDFDSDRDDDIILGALNFPFPPPNEAYSSQLENKATLLLLKNLKN